MDKHKIMDKYEMFMKNKNIINILQEKGYKIIYQDTECFYIDNVSKNDINILNDLIKPFNVKMSYIHY